MFSKILFLAILSIALPGSKGEETHCCFGDKGFNPLHFFSNVERGTCKDGTLATPCCGYSQCNWNCCECEGACRAPEGPPQLAILEARIILPKKTNTGESLDAVRAELESELIREFGGFTRITGDGGWANEGGAVFSDESWIYDIAVRPDKRAVLKEIAIRLRDTAKQEAIYYREDGKVKFVK